MKQFLPLSALFLLLAAAGCASTAKPETAQKTAPVPVRETITEKELLPIAEKLMRQQLDAIRKVDYEAWKKTMHPQVLAKTNAKSFRNMASSFGQFFGEPVEIHFLGSVAKYGGRTVLWKGKFRRGPAMEALMQKKQLDPAKTPLSEALITLACARHNGQWLVIGFQVN